MKINKPSKKVVIATVSVLSFIGLSFGFYQGLVATNRFFSVNELRFNKMIEVKFAKPVEIISKDQIKKEIEFNKNVDSVVDKVIKEYLNPEPVKEQSLILVKPVQAAGNYTYQNYSKKPFYPVVLAGIKERYTNWEDAAELEAREGGFDPGAINPSSGACGLPQALPCKKMGCSLTNIDCQLDWMKQYIGDRYGTVNNALKFRLENGWY